MKFVNKIHEMNKYFILLAHLHPQFLQCFDTYIYKYIYINNIPTYT